MYIGAFWLAFGLFLHHCSPKRAELPTTPRELRRTVKYKHKIGQTLYNLASVLYLEAQRNKEHRKVQRSNKKKNNDENILEKFS